MSLELELRAQNNVPVEVHNVIPSLLRDKSLEEILRTEIQHGNEKVELGEFFHAKGTCDDDSIQFSGNCEGVHWIGAKMDTGSISVDGNAGRHVGSEMTGGHIRVTGSVGDWVGAELKAGLIEVAKNAGHLVGAAYRGSPKGMTGGSIIVGGNAGNEIGHTMRRGTIAIGGSIGDLCGFNMLAGTILVGGESGIRHGAGMRRGTIAFLTQRPDLLPTFRYGCRAHPVFLRALCRQLSQTGQSFQIPETGLELYHGDFLESGRGEIWCLPAS